MARRRRKKDRLYLRESTFWCWFYDTRGVRQRRSTYKTDRALAEVAARRIERDHLEAAGRPQALRLDEALARFLAKSERKGCAEDTLSYYLKKSKRLQRVLGEGRDVHAITLADIEDYIDAREGDDAGLATISKEVNVLVSALRHAKLHQLYPGDPGALLPDVLCGTYTPRDRWLPLDEYGKLCGKLSVGRREYVMTYCGLGVRESEMYRLHATGIDEKRRVIHVRGKKTNRSDRFVPIPPELMPIFRRRAKAGFLFPRWGNARRDLRAACKAAGIAPVSHNDFRRTFASWLAEAGVHELVTASLMGHASSAMVRRVYARIGPAAQKAAIAVLPGLLTTVTTGVTNGARSGGRSGQGGRSRSRETPRNPANAVLRDGIEPPTRGFSVLCSTI